MPREYTKYWLEKYLEALKRAYEKGEITKYAYDKLRKGVMKDYESENA